MVTYSKISPRVVNPRDIAENAEEVCRFLSLPVHMVVDVEWLLYFLAYISLSVYSYSYYHHHHHHHHHHHQHHYYFICCSFFFLPLPFTSTVFPFPFPTLSEMSSKSRHDFFCFVLFCWLLNVPATCECISGTDLLRQFYVLPH